MSSQMPAAHLRKPAVVDKSKGKKDVAELDFQTNGKRVEKRRFSPSEARLVKKY